jgi:WD40 repeat protein
MYRSRLYVPAGALVAALLMAACGAATVPPTSTLTDEPMTTSGSTPASAGSGTLTPAPPTEAPASVPTAAPTATHTALPTPEAITIDIADRFQVIRESYSPEPYIKTFSLVISPDGRMAAVGGCEPEEDGNCYTRTVLRLLDIDTGRTLFNLEPLAPVIDLLAFSPDGTALAIAACDLPLYLVGERETICDGRRLWTVDTATGEVLHELGDFHSRITSLVWSPDGSRLFSGVEFLKQYDFVDNEITIFDTSTGKRLGIVEPAVNNCSEQWLDLSPDGRYLVLDLAADCAYPSFVQWWDVLDPSRPRSVHQEVPARYHRLSPDGTRILTVNTKDNTLRLFDLETGEAVAGFPAVARQFYLGTVKYLDSERLLLEIDGVPQFLDLSSGEVQPAPQPAMTRLNGFVFAPDGRTMMTYGSIDSDGLVTPSLSLWDTANWHEAPVAAYLMHNPFGLGGQPIFSQDQTRLVQVQPDRVSFVVWGSRPPEQADALKALQEYLGLLAGGEYAKAASQFVLEESAAWNTMVLDRASVAALVPEVDPADPAALLGVLCSDPAFPCAPVRDVTYQAQVDEDTYLFVVTFAGPDGEAAAWPLCARVPASKYCSRRDGMFEYYVRRQADGSFRIIGGLPPAIDLRHME